MSYLTESLSENEELKQEFEQHWVLWIPVYATALLGFFASATIFWFGKTFDIQAFDYITVALVALVGLLATSVFMNLILQARDQGVTNKRVVHKEGLISRNTEEINLEALETVEIKQSISGRIFGFGNVEVTGRGSSVIVFNKIKEPLKVKRAIENEASRAKHEQKLDEGKAHNKTPT